MRLFRHHDRLPADAHGGVLALGNFDGVHLGHRAVIGTALKAAREQGRPAGVMTFEPHPRMFFNPDQPPFRLTSLRTKAREIEAMGVDYLWVQHFDAAFAATPAETFVSKVLVEGLGVSHVVVGHGYVFGHRRRGDVTLLRAMAETHGFSVTAVDTVTGPDGNPASSTRIRNLIAAGDMAGAANLLGRFWEIEGRVEPGERRGRELGFPTANLRLGDYCRPAEGVYAVRAAIDRGEDSVWLDGIANYGRRPTFGKDDELLEVHLFDFSSDLYHQRLRVVPARRLRGEIRFEGVNALREQIIRDCARARSLLNREDGRRTDDALNALP